MFKKSVLRFFEFMICAFALAAPVNQDASAAQTITIGIGHQTYATGTYAPGIIMKETGLLEKHLPHDGKYKDVKFHIVWKDFSSGPPITAEMVKGNLQIGSMGDYPLILNGYESTLQKGYSSHMVAFTAYNSRGSGNGIVVPKNSPANGIQDLQGKTITVPFGSTAHGMTLKLMRDRGWVEGKDLTLVTQTPAEGVEAIRKNAIDGHADFGPWSELIEFRGYGRKVYDGGNTRVPYLYGVVVERNFVQEHPELVTAYLKAMLEANELIRKNPQEIAEKLEKWTGIEKEVQYLFLGPGGILTQDPTFKPEWIEALKYDATVLQKMGKMGEFNADAWLNDSWLKQAFKEDGLDYRAQLGRKDPVQVTGEDNECGVKITEPRMAAQIWPAGQPIQSYATPLCMMKAYQKMTKAGKKVNVIYTTDFETTLKLFGDNAYYLVAESGKEPLIRSFTTRRQAESFARRGAGGRVMDFEQALGLVK